MTAHDVSADKLLVTVEEAAQLLSNEQRPKA